MKFEIVDNITLLTVEGAHLKNKQNVIFSGTTHPDEFALSI